MVRKWSTDHVDIARIRNNKSIHAYVIKLKPHIKKNQLVVIYPDTVVDSLLFEEYFNDGNCPLRRGVIKRDYLEPHSFKWSDHILTYTSNWL
jgi:hypothetical protein